MSKTPSPAGEWQRIWVMLRQHDWTSLAIVPSSDAVEAARVAESLARTGRMEGERPVNMVNAVGVQLGDANQIIESIAGLAGQGHRVLVPVDPIADNPSTITIVGATSAALLVVRVGESLVGPAQESIEIVGRDRFLGAIVVDEHGRATQRPMASPSSQ